MDAVTIEQLKKALPEKMKQAVNPAVIQQIATTLNDPDMYESYRENLLSYAHVMQDGKFKMDCYISAVKYVSHKLMGKCNKDAFFATFPDKMIRWRNTSVAEKDQASYISAYSKSKLVTKILEQSLIPSWILNQDMYQKALNTQVELMTTAKSEKVRSDAANSILTHLKMPETQKIQLDVGPKTQDSIAALREATQQLAEQQRLAMASGSMSALQVAHSKVVIEGELDEQ
jgi:hypothetical protein